MKYVNYRTTKDETGGTTKAGQPFCNDIHITFIIKEGGYERAATKYGIGPLGFY